eukprot:4266494-Amphidinium_carterae.1
MEAVHPSGSADVGYHAPSDELDTLVQTSVHDVAHARQPCAVSRKHLPPNPQKHVDLLYRANPRHDSRNSLNYMEILPCRKTLHRGLPTEAKAGCFEWLQTSIPGPGSSLTTMGLNHSTSNVQQLLLPQCAT